MAAPGFRCGSAALMIQKGAYTFVLMVASKSDAQCCCARVRRLCKDHPPSPARNSASGYKTLAPRASAGRRQDRATARRGLLRSRPGLLAVHIRIIAALALLPVR